MTITSLESLLLFDLIVSVVLNLTFFTLAYILKTDKFTDITYAISFIVLISFNLFIADQVTFPLIAASIMIYLWAIRLGGYLMYRITKITKDDRFDEMREKFFSFLGFWILQAITVAIISISHAIFSFTSTSNEFTIQMVVGISISILGLIIETIADIQKFNFKTANPKEFCNVGLWKYARHPNYFGEMLMWWGIALATVSTIPISWIGFLSPLFITNMLLFVSGIPILKKKQEKTYGADPKFQEYYRNTRLLLPLPKIK